MIITNFKFLKRTGTNALNWEFWAEVDCIEGMWWWEKTKTRMVHKTYAGNWHFVDNGQWCPGYTVSNMYRAWEAQQKLAKE